MPYPGARAWSSILESRSFADALADSENAGRPAVNTSARVDRPHTHLGSDIPPQQTWGVPRQTQQARSSQRCRIGHLTSLLSMLYGVADLFRTILFILVPFRQLLRSFLRKARLWSSSKFLPAGACHLKSHDAAARRDGLNSPMDDFRRIQRMNGGFWRAMKLPPGELCYPMVRGVHFHDSEDLAMRTPRCGSNR
jgi:hypothetical protein